MVDLVETPIAISPGGSARGRRHQPQGCADAGQPMLLGPVVEGVPAQVFGVAPFGVAPRHGHEQGADLASTGSEHTVDFVGRGSWKCQLGPPVRVDFGVAGGDHPPKALAPGHFRAAEDLVHVGHVGPQRRVCIGGVLEDRLDADQLTHVGAVVLDADGFAAGPVDDDRGSRGDLHRPDAELDVVVFVDRVVVVRFVGVEPNRLARQHRIEAVGRCAALGPVGGADADDRQRDAVAVGDPGAHGLRRDLREAVVGPKRHARRIGFAQRAMALIAVDGAGGTEDEALCGSAMRKQRTRVVGVRLNAPSPVIGAGVDRRMEDIAEIVWQCGEVRVGHVQHERGDPGGLEFVAVGRVFQARRAPYLVALGERAGDRKGDLPGRAGDQDLLAVEHPLVIAHRHPNVKYLICWPCATAVR